MGIVENLDRLKNELPESVTIVAVSKTKPPESILEAYHSGHRDFGENKVQELVAKQEQLPRDIRWHMVGHLQSNKVRYLAPFIHMIHSVDSLKLLRVIDSEGEKNKRVIDCLLQVHIALEETKFGLSEDEIPELISSTGPGSLEHVRIRGLMGMATYTENREQVREEFRSLKRIFDRVRKDVVPENPWFDQLSIGMSGDYQIAVEEGSTLVRIGSILFGPR
jgi:PLP dependent protein